MRHLSFTHLRRLWLATLILGLASPLSAATLTLRLVNVGLPDFNWGLIKQTYISLFNSYSGIYAAYYTGIPLVTDGGGHVDFIFNGVEEGAYRQLFEVWEANLTSINQSLAAAGLRYDLIYDGQAVAASRIQEIRAFWPEAANLGDFWSWTNGMSYIWVRYYPWIYAYHGAVRNWLYSVPAQGGFYFYIPGRGWTWTAGDIGSLIDL